MVVVWYRGTRWWCGIAVRGVVVVVLLLLLLLLMCCCGIAVRGVRIEN